MRIALTGNPNSGKTTMYNALTGSSEKVGNWAGVTVEQKENTVKKSFCPKGLKITAVDLPGAYSMSPFTSEESITSSFVKDENPDVIINIVDATNLSRSLFFTTQLLELGIPVVVALNKSDVTEKKDTKIDAAALSKRLGCKVIHTASTHGEGLKEVIDAAVSVRGTLQKAPYVDANVNLKSKKAVEEADRKRFEFVNTLVKSVEKRKVFSNSRNSQDKIDEILTNKYLGIPIFAVVMYLVFWLSQSGPGVWISDSLVAYLEMGQQHLAEFFSGASPLVSSLLIDGVIGGVIAVIGFLPLVMVMYFFIALLEDCGYMARVSVVLDPIFKKVGLSGKSVIPFVIATGCAVPGVMACRAIRTERERRAAALLAPFMPCGAKLPVIALFAGAFFPGSAWVGPLMYFVGIVIIFLGALIVNRITGTRQKKSFFIMELPEYKIPSFLRAFTSMCSRGWAYIVKAATIILICNTAVQVMQTFTLGFDVATVAEDSILSVVARPFAYVLYPIVGVVSWQLAAAALTGFIAKENVVGTLAVCFAGLNNLVDADTFVAMEAAGQDVSMMFAITKLAALSYLMFNLFSPPCFAAMGAMNSEMKSAKWLLGGISLQLGVGYTLGYFVYQIGTLFSTGHMGEGFLSGLLVVCAIAAIITYLCIKPRQNNVRM